MPEERRTVDEMSPSWSFVDAREYAQRINDGMPPVIVTCATTGEHRKRDHARLPASAEEQAEAAKTLFAAGARIIHIHGRVVGDPDRTQRSQRYREINELIRAAAPDILIDNTQTVAELSIEPHAILRYGSLLQIRADRSTT